MRIFYPVDLLPADVVGVARGQIADELGATLSLASDFLRLLLGVLAVVADRGSNRLLLAARRVVVTQLRAVYGPDNVEAYAAAPSALQVALVVARVLLGQVVDEQAVVGRAELCLVLAQLLENSI